MMHDRQTARLVAELMLYDTEMLIFFFFLGYVERR